MVWFNDSSSIWEFSFTPGVVSCLFVDNKLDSLQYFTSFFGLHVLICSTLKQKWSGLPALDSEFVEHLQLVAKSVTSPFPQVGYADELKVQVQKNIVWEIIL